jgi:uncharacterized protein (DUF58 family)
MVGLIKENWLLLAFLAIVAGVFLLLRNTPSDIKSAEELNRQLAAGRPTVVTFYSDF